MLMDLISAVCQPPTLISFSISVTDNGPGMEEKQLRAALQGSGGGQGLPIVQRLVESNGGSLAFETSPGSGTRAILTFHGTGGIDHEI